MSKEWDGNEVIDGPGHTRWIDVVTGTERARRNAPRQEEVWGLYALHELEECGYGYDLHVWVCNYGPEGAFSGSYKDWTVGIGGSPREGGFDTREEAMAAAIPLMLESARRDHDTARDRLHRKVEVLLAADRTTTVAGMESS